MISGFSSSFGTRFATKAPIADVTKAASALFHIRRKLTIPLRVYSMTAVIVPHIEEVLLTASSVTAGTFGRKAMIPGSWISPPPPAIESMKPAQKAMAHSPSSCQIFMEKGRVI